MPQVPYQPYPTAQPSEQGVPEVRVHTPPAAFGENIGRALEHLGTVGKQAGDELFHRAIALQELQNQTEAKEADAKYSQEAGLLHAEFSARQGANASAAYPKYIEDLRAKREEIRNSLSTDMSRRHYDANSLGTLGRSIFNGAGHAATQMKVAAGNASVARVDIAQQGLYNTPDDEGAYNSYKNILAAEIKNQADLAGWLPEQAKDQYEKHLSKGIAMRIAGKAKSEPWTAAEWLEAFKGDLRPEDAVRLQNSVMSSQYGAGARNIVDKVLADKVNGEGEDKPFKYYHDKAMKDAEKLQAKYPYLTDIGEHVEKELDAKWNRIEYGNRQLKNESLNTIYGAIEESQTKNSLPASIDELTAHDGKVKAAYEALDNRSKKQVRDALTTLNRRGDRVDDTTSLQTRDRLWGLAKNDPEKFMDTDLYSKDLKINPADRKFLTTMREKMTAHPDDDPRVPRAIGWLREARGAEMEALHVYRREQQWKDDYDHMTGALGAAIQEWEKVHGHSPSRKDVIDEIWPSISKHKEGSFLPTWLGGTAEEPALFNVPAAKIEAIQTEAKEKLKIDLTEEEARRAYLASEFQKLYKSQKGVASK